MPRILIADDHAFVRRGVRSLLASTTEWTVVGEAENGFDAVRLTRELRPEVLLLDVTMPGMTGLEVVRAIRENDSKTKIILLTLHDSAELIQIALRLGVNGYLQKIDAEGELVKAVRVVLGDGVYLSPKLDPKLAQSLVEMVVSLRHRKTDEEN